MLFLKGMLGKVLLPNRRAFAAPRAGLQEIEELRSGLPKKLLARSATPRYPGLKTAADGLISGQTIARLLGTNLVLKT